MGWKVIVCGSRSWKDEGRIFVRLYDLPRYSVIITGGASGADTFAMRAARVMGHTFREFRADWETYGKRAGPIRNQRMLDESMPVDLLLAFWDGHSRGTRHMISIAEKAGVPIEVHLPENVESQPRGAALPNQGLKNVIVDPRLQGKRKVVPLKAEIL